MNRLRINIFKGSFENFQNLLWKNGRKTCVGFSEKPYGIQRFYPGRSNASLLAKPADVSRLRSKEFSVPRRVSFSTAEQLEVSFDDGRQTYKSKTNWELIRGILVFAICKIPYITENSLQLMKRSRSILGDKLFAFIMKLSFYGQFVAGEDTVKIMPKLIRMRYFHVMPILDYSVEEDLSHEEAEEREYSAILSSAESQAEVSPMKQFSPAKKFADRRMRVESARTYFYLNESTCEKNMIVFLKCMEALADLKSKSPDPVGEGPFSHGLAAIKLTALGRPQLLLQLSEAIMQTRNYFNQIFGGEGDVMSHHVKREEFEKKIEEAKMLDKASVKQFLDHIEADEEGILHVFPWSGIVDESYKLSSTFRIPDLKSGRMVRLMSQLPEKEEEMFKNMIRRTNNVVRAAKEFGIGVMIDAEQTYFQPAIWRITLEMMRKYNKEKCVVFNTYQCYLTDTLQTVTTDLHQARRQKFNFGCKLVRGAYMEQERERAQLLGYPDPIHPTFEATTKMYYDTLVKCMEHIKIYRDEGKNWRNIGIMVASHNEDTVRFTIQKMKELGISPEDRVISFGQLLGMCDYLTFPLGQSGYSSYKYTPYGPVIEVLPYLARRAVENSSLLSKLNKEQGLLRKELFRRWRSGQFVYAPKVPRNKNVVRVR